MSAPASSSTPSRSDTTKPSTAPSDGDHHELKDLSSPGPPLPVEEDIMQLARLGEIGAIQNLFDGGKYDATYCDEQSITPLHWAAINGHYALCHFLIQKGANLNAKGGDAVATPVLWAAKRCHYYVVNLLLQHGADPLLTDDQGFNLLHSATLDGNVYQLIILLHQDIPVDIPDAQGHTSLMWAAYKGYPACVDLLLRWGASVSARDDQGFTALHWSLVKGSYLCVQKLVEYGADRFAENNDGKTPAITADDMGTTSQWHRALSECGFNSDGKPRYFPLQSVVKDRRKFLSRFFFLWPSFILLCVIYIMSHMVIYAAVPISLFVGWSLQWIAQRALRWAPSDMKHIHKTPFLAGIFAGTLFWVGVRWLVRILPWTLASHLFSNILFVACYGLCTYFYFVTMLEDPGYIPKSGSRNQQKAIIEELLDARKFDEHNFCVYCMIRKPLRSKHCKRCGRCVAKTDHHCPWVDNCVANNNHRHFLLYIIFMIVGILLLVRLVLAYLENLPVLEGVQCNILADELCAVLYKDPFTIVLTLFAAFQLIWVAMLLIVQVLQIARAMTTYESMRGHLHPHSTGDAITSFITTGSTSLEGGQLAGSGAGSDGEGRRGHRHRRKEGFFAQWKRLLGLDTFFATAFHGSRAAEVQRRQRGNPFSRGILTNCRDFWCEPGPVFGKKENGAAFLGGERVDYTKMYEAPARMSVRRFRGDGGDYVAVNTDDNV